jgi:type IX secretion system PorP/SprF family membrane protein
MSSSCVLTAQQEPIFTQFYVNKMIINPAVSGSTSYNFFNIQNRQQWLGFTGAPYTSNISYNGALNNRSAMGGYLMFDQAYPSLQANLNINYAYHIPLNNEQLNLSFGIGAKLMYHSIDFNREELPPGSDNAFSARAHDCLLGDASSGLFLYSKKFYFGFSSSNMLQSSFNEPVDNRFDNSLVRNYYSMFAYRFRIINNDWQLEPSFLLRKAHGFSNISDLNTRIIYLKDNWTGLSYRTDGTVVFSFGFASGNTHFSYSYDHTFKAIQQYSYGTHEFGISFRIPTLATKRHIGFWQY